MDYLDKRVGILDASTLPEFQQGIDLCINNGLIHSVAYNFGTTTDPISLTMLFPTSHELAIKENEFGNFDKIHATAGMLVYATKISTRPIRMPSTFFDRLMEGSIRVRTPSSDMFRQYSPMIYSGMISLRTGQSVYETSYGPQSYSGRTPELLNTEENRDTLRTALRLFNSNEDFIIPSSIRGLRDSNFANYEDTAGHSRKINRKKRIVDIILNKNFRTGA